MSGKTEVCGQISDHYARTRARIAHQAVTMDAPGQGIGTPPPPGWAPIPSRPRPTSRPPGRPSDYSPDLAQRLALAIACGDSVRKVCAKPWAPNRMTFYRWLARPDFLRLYSLAVDFRIDCLYDEIIEIADNLNIPTERARLMIDARKWIIERMRPRKYGRQARNPQPLTVTIRIQTARERVQQLRGLSLPTDTRARLEPPGDTRTA